MELKSIEDLVDVDFARGYAPAVVTAVLADEADAGAVGQVWDLPVSHRIARLLAVVQTAESSESLSLVAPCQAPGCGEQIEMEVTFQALRALAPEDAGARIDVEVEPGSQLSFRLATGNDQIAWSRLEPAPAEDLYRRMAASLLVGGQSDLLDERGLESLSEAMEEFDPLPGFRTDVGCPQCGWTQQVEVDIQQLCLTMLSRSQREVMQQVHRLARAYGWPEGDILRIPAWRRRRYLALVEDQRR